jgi:hypothetical protein
VFYLVVPVTLMLDYRYYLREWRNPEEGTVKINDNPKQLITLTKQVYFNDVAKWEPPTKGSQKDSNGHQNQHEKVLIRSMNPFCITNNLSDSKIMVLDKLLLNSRMAIEIIYLSLKIQLELKEIETLHLRSSIYLSSKKKMDYVS